MILYLIIAAVYFWFLNPYSLFVFGGYLTASLLFRFAVLEDETSVQGRLSRGGFFLRFLVVVGGFWAALGLYFLILGLGFRFGWELQVGLSGILIALAVGADTLMAVYATQRLRDLGRPAGHYWYLMIPVFDLYMMVCLFFRGRSRQVL